MREIGGPPREKLSQIDPKEFQKLLLDAQKRIKKLDPKKDPIGTAVGLALNVFPKSFPRNSENRDVYFKALTQELKRGTTQTEMTEDELMDYHRRSENAALGIEDPASSVEES